MYILSQAIRHKQAAQVTPQPKKNTWGKSDCCCCSKHICPGGIILSGKCQFPLLKARSSMSRYGLHALIPESILNNKFYPKYETQIALNLTQEMFDFLSTSIDGALSSIRHISSITHTYFATFKLFTLLPTITDKGPLCLQQHIWLVGEFQIRKSPCNVVVLNPHPTAPPTTKEIRTLYVQSEICNTPSTRRIKLDISQRAPALLRFPMVRLGGLRLSASLSS